jgi:hypothetical protein
MTKQEPAIKRDLVEVVAKHLSDDLKGPLWWIDNNAKARNVFIPAAQAVLAALMERGQVMHEGGQKIHVNFPFLVLQMEE